MLLLLLLLLLFFAKSWSSFFCITSLLLECRALFLRCNLVRRPTMSTRYLYTCTSTQKYVLHNILPNYLYGSQSTVVPGTFSILGEYGRTRHVLKAKPFMQNPPISNSSLHEVCACAAIDDSRESRVPTDKHHVHKLSFFLPASGAHICLHAPSLIIWICTNEKSADGSSLRQGLEEVDSFRSRRRTWRQLRPCGITFAPRAVAVFHAPIQIWRLRASCFEVHGGRQRK